MLEAEEAALEAALHTTHRLASQQAAAAAAAAALALTITLAEQRDALARAEAVALALAASAAAKLARDKAEAISLEAELAVQRALAKGQERLRAALERGESCGVDDMGNVFASLAELWAWQDEKQPELYAANSKYWEAGGYCGATAETAMMGDTGSRQDIADSHAFLSGLVTRWPRMHLSTCLDAGAGVGRVTKHLLLRHCRTVHLVESSSKWSRLSRGYLGKKRSKACTFTQARIETFVPRPGSIDLVWVQWVLQYLTDADAVQTLRNLASGLAPHGVVVLKENCPYLITCDVRMFQCDTPAGENARYDITRPDKHHRILFERAGLEVLETETTAVETNFWVLQRRKQKKQLAPVLVLATTGAGKKTKNKKHARLKKKGKMKKK